MDSPSLNAAMMPQIHATPNMMDDTTYNRAMKAGLNIPSANPPPTSPIMRNKYRPSLITNVPPRRPDFSFLSFGARSTTTFIALPVSLLNPHRPHSLAPTLIHPPQFGHSSTPGELARSLAMTSVSAGSTTAIGPVAAAAGLGLALILSTQVLQK